MIDIRPLTEREDLKAVVRLQRQIWGFEDVDLIPGFAMPPAEPLHLARFAPAERCYWLGAPADWKGDAAHPTPRRQILVTVQGEYEVSAGDGTKRRFPVGSVCTSLPLESNTWRRMSPKMWRFLR